MMTSSFQAKEGRDVVASTFRRPAPSHSTGGVVRGVTSHGHEGVGSVCARLRNVGASSQKEKIVSEQHDSRGWYNRKPILNVGGTGRCVVVDRGAVFVPSNVAGGDR
jgi:hypothetical protein